MVIKDIKGMYSIEVDSERKVVKEKQVGLWLKEDVDRFHQDYMNKVIPQLEGANGWANICDLRDYKTSDVVDVLRDHIQWKVQHGLQKAAIIVDNPIKTMQMMRIGGAAMEPMSFTSEEEASKWLSKHGF
ncbi:hypothetical protein [Vallitalea okinawensis]|uniref:hypothetical protein n=1 Tax=Vallitalea okinawensis TaxID=2078660 RepID=UPI000CFB653A|nr:hypothetical protein [Vallitalea okinawensis]